MKKFIRLLAMLAAAVMLLTGCGLTTVEQMYSLPKRSTEYNNLQTAIDSAMGGREYAAPLSGENQQTVQAADLDGDGDSEYLLFTRSTDEKPLHILIFSRGETNYELIETIESNGSAFQLVEYVNMDDRPGVELIVGRSVSDQVLGAVSVYTFSGGRAEQLMSVNYHQFVTADLDDNGLSDLLVISKGDEKAPNASAFLYSYSGGTMARSGEVSLSAPPENIKRIMVSTLSGGIPAVYVASAVDESAVITDVFAMKEERFTNVSLSNESGTSVQTLRNYYVYADDIDEDGELELPSLITMTTPSARSGDGMKYLIRWYAMGIDGSEVDKMYTFHNFDAGWYMLLDSAWAHRILVNQDGGSYTFYMWDRNFESSDKIFTVYTLTGSDREEAAVADGRFILRRGDGVLYCARLEEKAADFDITPETLVEWFRFIQFDWKTGET